MTASHIRPSFSEFALAQRLATLLDNQFRLGKWGFGLDAFIDLLPVGGDVVILVLSLFLVVVGIRAKLPQAKIIEMLVNIGIAFAIGLIPIIGDIAYLAFKPNLRNLEILRAYKGVQ